MHKEYMKGNYMKKSKIYSCLNKVSNAFCLPHIKAVIHISVVALSTLIISVLLHILNAEFSASLFANVFAGLITGLIVCLVSGIKGKTTSDIIEKKEWLQKLVEMLRVYFSDYDKLLRLKFDKYNGDENLYIFFYDAHTHANNINSEILQKQFDKTIDFVPREYCKEKFNYDANELIGIFDTLHANVEHIDVDCPSSSQIVSYFNDVHLELKKLNSSIHKEIRNLDEQLSKIQKMII